VSRWACLREANVPAQVMLILMASAPVAVGKAIPQAAVKLCQLCHGAQGEGMPAAGIPRISGQSPDYLEKQLRDYASGVRENPIMKNWAKQLSDAQRSELAAYYASLPAPLLSPTVAPAIDPTGATQRERGHQLAHQGDEIRQLQACDNCHGPDGRGLAHSAPYLAGQWAQYLTNQIKAWREGTRKNDAGKLMSSVAERLNDADTAAVAAYFSSLATSPD
jgi:cytochrome c553